MTYNHIKSHRKSGLHFLCRNYIFGKTTGGRWERQISSLIWNEGLQFYLNDNIDGADPTERGKYSKGVLEDCRLNTVDE